MSIKSGLIGIAVLVAVGFASPAFAQQPAISVYNNGLNAFDLVTVGGGGSFAPAAHGGGSFGYNENLRRNQW